MKPKTKILIATGIFPPQVGGPATYSELLLKELPKKGLEVRVQSLGWLIHYPKVVRHVCYFFKVLKNAFWADLIYAQDAVFVGLAALVSAKLTRKKILVKIVGDYAWEQGCQNQDVIESLDLFSQKSSGYSLKISFLKKIQKFVASRVDQIIVPSAYLKQIVVHWGIKPTQITVVYNAFVSPQSLSNKEELRQNCKITGPMLVTAGRLIQGKGFLMLIKLMPRLIQVFPEMKLIIVGEGPDKGVLENAMRDCGVEKWVELTGRKTQIELFALIKAADLFLLNTVHEGLSHVILEALALGTPVITTPAGGNVEIITDHVNGLFVAYNEENAWYQTIADLLADNEKRKALSQMGLEKVAHFSQEKMLGEIMEILKSI
jgi:glycosyltransferase involved in cell wall biosynthesis